MACIPLTKTTDKDYSREEILMTGTLPRNLPQPSSEE